MLQTVCKTQARSYVLDAEKAALKLQGLFTPKRSPLSQLVG